ncbi:hypothetical protein ACFB49_23790 [Sphingomonas sp. DBB INV C78]
MADLTDRGGAIASHIPAMPIHVAAQPAGWIFLIGTLLILSSILAWWAIGGERRERGWALPFVFVGTALSAVVIEPIFDNTLLYWYPPVNELAFFRGFERTIPWYVPLGYAWFFGGTAYLLARRFERGITSTTLWTLFAGVVVIDWLAVSICEWLNLSAFYGSQPFHLFGSPLWFSFCDATGAFVLAGALHMLLPHLAGTRRLWLLIVPLFTYGATLGSTTAPVTIALNSGWPMVATWMAGAATMVLCMIAVHTVGLIAARPR